MIPTVQCASTKVDAWGNVPVNSIAQGASDIESRTEVGGVPNQVKAFAHGTSLENAKNIEERGLNADEALKHSRGRHIEGFFTHEIGPPSNPGVGLQQAADWAGMRHAVEDMALVIISIPALTFDALKLAAQVKTGPVPGFEGTPMPDETIFLPSAFDVVNREATFQILKLNR